MTSSGPVPVGVPSGWSDGQPEGIPSSRPASTPVCRWPTSWSLAGPAWLRSSPNTIRGLLQALDPPPSTGAEAPVLVGWSVLRFRIPSPCSAWMHGARVGDRNQPNWGYSPIPEGISPAERPSCTTSSTGWSAERHSPGPAGVPAVHVQAWREGLTCRPQVTRIAPAKSAPRAARPPMAPVAPRSAGLRVVEWIAAAAPDNPTRRSFTRRAVR